MYRGVSAVEANTIYIREDNRLLFIYTHNEVLLLERKYD